MTILWWLRVTVKLILRRFFLIPAFCKVCGRNIRDFTAPDDAWRAVTPLIRRGNALCYDCFCDLCNRAGLPSTWRLIPAEPWRGDAA